MKKKIKLYGGQSYSCIVGTTIILPCLDRVTKIDMRTRAFSVPPQKVKLIKITELLFLHKLAL